MYNYIYLRYINLIEKYCFFFFYSNFCLNFYDFYLIDRLLLEEMLNFFIKKFFLSNKSIFSLQYFFIIFLNYGLGVN